MEYQFDEECTALERSPSSAENGDSSAVGFSLLTSYCVGSMLGGVAAVFDFAQNAVQGAATLVLTVLHLNYVVVNSVFEDITYIVYSVIEFGHGISQPVWRVGGVCVSCVSGVCNGVLRLYETTLYTAGVVCRYFGKAASALGLGGVSLVPGYLSALVEGFNKVGISIYSAFVPINVEIHPDVVNSGKQDALNENLSRDFTSITDHTEPCFIRWITGGLSTCVSFFFNSCNSCGYFLRYIVIPAFGNAVYFIINLPVTLWNGLRFSIVYFISCINVLCSSVAHRVYTTVSNVLSGTYTCLSNWFFFFTEIVSRVLTNIIDMVSDTFWVLHDKFYACKNVITVSLNLFFSFFGRFFNTIFNSVCRACLGVVHSLSCVIAITYNFILQFSEYASNFIQLILFEVIPSISFYLILTCLALIFVKFLPPVVRSTWVRRKLRSFKNFLLSQFNWLFHEIIQEEIPDEAEFNVAGSSGASGSNYTTDQGVELQTQNPDDVEISLLLRASASAVLARKRRRSSSEKSPENLRKLRLQLAEERDQKLCSVCLDSYRNVVLIPCKHMCVCQGCIVKIIWNIDLTPPKCPLCRELVQAHIVVNT